MSDDLTERTHTMTEHTYTPGQRVTIGDSDYPHYYVGTTRHGLIATEDESGWVVRLLPAVVAPYVEPAAITEVPDGWELIPSDKLEKGVHKVYSPDSDYPWLDAGVRETANLRFPVLVVARRALENNDE